jgi:uncharacterized membrane protein
MNHTVDEISEKHFRKKFDQLGEREKSVAHHLAARTHVSTDVVRDHFESMTFGQRLADRVAAFGGSWTFIIIFGTVLFIWILLNSYVLVMYHDSFDPYPYILLNLFLSMLAAIQAPIIMMSQNRQNYKDRVNAEHDYEVNLKAELEILTLHEKIDALRDKQWKELIALQQEQMRMLGQLTGAGK